MRTGRTGGALLLAAGALASIFAVCLSSAALAGPQDTIEPVQPATIDADGRTSAEDLESAQQALLTRIRELEETQTRMLDQIKDITNDVQTRPVTRQVLTSESLAAANPHWTDDSGIPSFNWLLGGFTVFACALCVVLLLRVRQPETLSTESFADPIIPPSAHHPEPNEEEASGGNDARVHPFVPTLPDWDASSPAIDLHSISIFSPETTLQAHDSAIELADIMLSFGRVNSAAEALAGFIEKNPRESVTPWLKLLDVYRESGQRAEFDKVAKELNKTFNVWGVTWENFNESRDPAHGLEEMPHIVARLQLLWGSRQGQAYLQYLLRDTRNATRQGFSLTTIDDILCLNAILKDDLGPYTGPVDDIFAANDDPIEEAPPTEIEPDTRPVEQEAPTAAPRAEEA